MLGNEGSIKEEDEKMNGQDSANKILKFSVAACLLMIGGSFFYHFVIYIPAKENQKISLKKQEALNKIKSENQTKQQKFNDDARSLLIEYFSHADNVGVLMQDTLTYGESNARYNSLADNLASLKNRALTLKPNTDEDKAFILEFIKTIEEFMDYSLTEVKVVDYYLQNLQLEDVIKTYREQAAYMRSDLFTYSKAAEFENEANKLLSDFNEKKEMIDLNQKQLDERGAVIFSNMWSFYNQYGDVFNISSETVLRLSRARIADASSAKPDDLSTPQVDTSK